MIKLDIKKYCNDCTHFEAKVIEPESIDDGFGRIHYIGDYLIRCKNSDVCNDLLKRRNRYDNTSF